MSKNIAILGSTGSIGTNTLEVIDSLGSGYDVVALTAHRNVKLLAEQVRKYKPAVVGITDADCYSDLRAQIGPMDIEILVGADCLTHIARLDDVDLVMMAVVGAAGLEAVLAAAEEAKTLAIANKEPLVIAGELLTTTARRTGATILPVDSEHSAIFQSMKCGTAQEVSRIILTSSGGPFRTATAQQMRNATIEDALSHPTWTMGPKITIDSATMMNKALEVIEARWLFDIPVDKIDVLVHPESVVHSLVEFVDGTIIAQLGKADMRLPIQYALTYPRRLKGPGQCLRLEQLGKLTFQKPNLNTFRALSLGYEVARMGRAAPVVFNAANESAVENFLAGNIKFGMIVELIEHCLDKYKVSPPAAARLNEPEARKRPLTLPELLEIDRWARNEVSQCLKQNIR